MNAFLKRLLPKRQCYRRMFLRNDGSLTPDAEVILTDLRKFCRATSSTAMVSPSTGAIDPIAMALAEGRREVFNRINEMLHLKDHVIHNLREENPDD